MKYRANEAKDAVMLKALNVMSIYDGDNKGRGEKIRTQAALTFKLANDLADKNIKIKEGKKNVT